MTEREVPLEPVRPGGLGALLERRRSTRDFAPRPLSLALLSLVLRAAQGRTGDGRRTCPSAHALYPLAVTAVAGDVDGLPAGVYRYGAERDALTLVSEGDHRRRVSDTTLADRDWLPRAPVLLLISGDLEAAGRHFADQPPQGRRGERYVWLEAGHAGQNVYLQAAEAGLGAVLVAGFDDERLLGLAPAVVPPGHHPLGLIGVGHPADRRE
ncbi:SagB/ThcOx family dehydrogenase [Nocardiopsis potens]|uniref:SagB/ThcOx family dehydrogenase n=1 Tax=Nocardiopsis potens TaxID=1246458 RepID=UPI00137700DF|nr:SagB/ThcOx family dehydrogenase [Nocardiopsis potens]